MNDFPAFRLLAHAALRRFNVVIGCYYGSRDTTTMDGIDRYYIAANGQGLPAAGVEVRGETATAAVDAMVRMLKARQRQADEEYQERERAKRAAWAAEAAGHWAATNA